MYNYIPEDDLDDEDAVSLVDQPYGEPRPWFLCLARVPGRRFRARCSPLHYSCEL